MKPLKRPHLFTYAIAFILSIFFAQAQEFTAGINTETPNPNAVLHLVSPNGDQGLLIPALTNAQRGAMGLTTTDKGLLVFDSDDDAFYFWDGAGWVGLNVPASIADGIDWSELTGIPAGFADGTDNGLTVVTSADITDGTIATADIANLAITNAKINDVAVGKITGAPNLDLDATDDVAVGTSPAAGDVSGSYTAGFTVDNVDYANISNLPPNLDTDATDDVAVGTSPAAGDVSGSYTAGFTVDNVDYANISNLPPNLDTDATDDIVSGSNISLLTNDAGYLVAGDNVSTLTNDAGFITAESQDLNAVLTISNDAGLNTIANVGDPVNPQDAATRNYVDTQGFITAESQDLNAVLTISNDAGTNTIVNVGDPVNPQDAATRNYVDTQGFITAESQDLNAVLTISNDAGLNTIANVGDPVNPQDAATRNYVDTQGFITAEAQDLTLTGNTLAISGDPNTDVNLSFNAPADGDVLTWDNTNGRWDAITPTVTGDMFAATYDPNTIAGDAFDFSNHISFTPPADGDVLTWDNTNGRWDAITPASPLNSGSGITINTNNIDLGGTLTAPANITTVAAGPYHLTVNGDGEFHSQVNTRFTQSVNLTDAGLTIEDDGDGTKGAKFVADGITTATIRQYTLPDQDGTLALLSDIGGLVSEPNASSIVGGTGAGPTVGGTNNTIYGVNAGNAVTSGSGNTLIGSVAGQSITTGFENTIIGTGSGASTTGNGNVFMGALAANANTSGSNNIVIGAAAGNGNTGVANTTGSNVILIGHLADVGADALTNATAIGRNAVVGTSNSLVLGGTGADAVNVGIGTTTPRAPLQIGGEFSIGYFQNSIEGISGDAILSNLYPDYTNLSDNELRRSNTDSASFIFFDDGEILFMNVVNGAADSQLALSGGDIRSWMEMRNNGNIEVSEGIRLGSPDVGDEEDGMIRYNGSSFEGYSAGAWNPLGGGGLSLPYSSGATDPSTLFDITQSGSGGAGRFQVTNGTNTVEALGASSDGAAGAIAFRAIGNVAADAGEFIVDGTGTALQVNNTATSSGVVASFQNNNSGNGNNVVSITTNGSGPALQINNTGTSGNAIRIDMNGANTVPGVEIVNSNGPSLTTDGFVGVGTVSPGSELEVAGETRTTTLNVASNRFVVANNGNTSITPTTAIDALNINQNNAARGITVNMNGGATTGIEVFNSGGPSIVTDGDVGIGTGSPAGPLDVNLGINNAFFRANNPSSAFGLIQIENTEATTGDAAIRLTVPSYSTTFGIDQSDGRAFKINMGTTLGAVGSPDFAIATTGEVGIGTSTPAATLDVNGTANVVSDAIVGNLISTPNTDAIIDGNVSADTRVVVLTADDNIMNISTPADGKEIFIIAGSGVNPQVSSGGNIRLDQTQGDFTMQSGSSIHLIYIENLSLWVEVSRSL